MVSVLFTACAEVLPERESMNTLLVSKFEDVCPKLIGTGSVQVSG